MKSAKFMVSAVFFVFCVFSSIEAFSAPSILSVDISKTIVKITGTNFGTKTTAAPIRFETSEGYTPGNYLADESNWWVDRDGYVGEVISDQNQRSPNSTRNILAHINETNTPITWKENVGFADTGKLFVSLWLRMDWGKNGKDNAPYAYQIKLHNFSTSIADNGAAEGAVTSLYAWWYPSASVGYPRVYNTSSGGSMYFSPGSLDQNYKWYNIVHQIDLGTAGKSDGKFYAYISDGSGYVANLGNGTGKLIIGAGDSPIDSIKMFNYLDANESPDIDISLYYDDIYIDNSWARVELGDASTYDKCTHREMQPPTSWVSTSISVTLNNGSFSEGDTVYLYVVNDDGVASDGYGPFRFGDNGIILLPPKLFLNQ